MLNRFMYVDPRYQAIKGSIVDIGCLHWDWSWQFGSIRPVIGFDPIERLRPAWGTLINKAVSVSSGKIYMNSIGGDGDSLVFKGKNQFLVESVAFSEVIKEYSPIAILKMNIEGGEFPILMSVNHPIADQLVVSFHDDSWIKGESFSKKATEAVKSYLSNWYTPIEIFAECGWVLFLKK